LETKLRSPGRPVLLDFYADWCVSCKEMEAFTFSDPKVRAELDRMLLLQVDVTANNDDDRALLKRFSLFGPPGIIFFDAEGREIKGLRVIGYQNADRFLKTLSLATAP
jgi:thiol:disulfide interchange protein DsbD